MRFPVVNGTPGRTCLGDVKDARTEVVRGRQHAECPCKIQCVRQAYILIRTSCSGARLCDVKDVRRAQVQRSQGGPRLGKIKKISGAATTGARLNALPVRAVRPTELKAESVITSTNPNPAIKANLVCILISVS
jgi:hypothetical protein